MVHKPIRVIHQVQVEHGRAGYRATCSSCMFVGPWMRHNEHATLDAIQHQINMNKAAA